MKILLLTSEFPPYRGGIGAYARELAAAAAADGHEAVVLAPDYGADQTELDGASAFRVVRFPGGPADARGLGRRVLETFRMLGRERFDLIHAIDWPFFVPLRLAGGLQPKARFLLTVHGTEIIYMQSPKRKRLLDLIGFWRRGWATWIGNSRYTIDLLLRRFPVVGAEHARAIPLGVSQAWRDARTPRDQARLELGVTDQEILMVSLGRVVPRKGHGVIAQALDLLPEAVQARLRWWVIGPLLDEAYAAELKATTAALACPVTFFGNLPQAEVQQRLSAADLFCLPGYQDEGGRVEGFGLVFLEAAAYGVPSIATLSGGIPEAVDDGKTGLLVAERDPLALAGAIRRLCEDDDLRRRFSAAALAKAEAASWAAVMRRTYLD